MKPPLTPHQAFSFGSVFWPHRFTSSRTSQSSSTLLVVACYSPPLKIIPIIIVMELPHNFYLTIVGSCSPLSCKKYFPDVILLNENKTRSYIFGSQDDSNLMGLLVMDPQYWQFYLLCRNKAPKYYFHFAIKIGVWNRFAVVLLVFSSNIQLHHSFLQPTILSGMACNFCGPKLIVPP